MKMKKILILPTITLTKPTPNQTEVINNNIFCQKLFLIENNNKITSLGAERKKLALLKF